MSILDLHQNQLRILGALRSAARILRLADHLVIVGSLGSFLGGRAVSVGDVDVLLDAESCDQFWDFVEILSLHGVNPVFDVIERPDFSWNHCRPEIAHGLAFTVDPTAHVMGVKHANLDLQLGAADLQRIERSRSWVYLIRPDEIRDTDPTAREARITEGHEQLLESISEPQRRLTGKRFEDEFHLELGMRFRVPV